jgi:hypothetical protein
MKKQILAAALCLTTALGMTTPVTATVNATKTSEKKAVSKKKKSKMEIVESGYYVQPTSEYSDTVYVYFWAKIKNNDKSKSIEFPEITATAKNDAGTILATTTQTGNYIAPKDTAILMSQMDTGSEEPTSVEIKTKKPTLVKHKSIKTSQFEVSNVAEVTDSIYSSKVTGELTYNGKKDLNSVAVSAIYKSGDQIVFVSQTYLDNIDGKSTTAFEITPWTASDLPAHDSVEVVAQHWY